MVNIEMANGKNIKIELYPDVAPITVANFEKLVKEGFYDGLIFHRVISGFMIQGGDPMGTGMGGAKEKIKGEFLANGVRNDLKHTREVMKQRNEEKAKLLYDFLDQSKLFKGTVVPEDRSLMNVPFITGNADLDAKFVKESKEAGLENLKGHRTVGGMRASIYNAMPKKGVETLVAFMKKFEEENL